MSTFCNKLKCVFYKYFVSKGVHFVTKTYLRHNIWLLIDHLVINIISKQNTIEVGRKCNILKAIYT